MREQVRVDGLLHTLCGTPAYVAPEILGKKGYDGAKVDVWSCGVILFVLVAGYLPFNDPNLMVMYKKIYSGEFRCPRWFSPELRQFLARVLDTNPETRITVDGIVNDPWFRKGYKEVKFHVEEDLGEKVEVEEKVVELNAFDLIAFSSGLNLSGLFDGEVGEEGERFLLRESAERVVEMVEAAAKVEGLAVRRRKECGVEVEGCDSNFVIAVEVYRLAEEVVVVEAKGRGGGALEVWKNKLRPHLCAATTSHEEQTQSNQTVCMD